MYIIDLNDFDNFDLDAFGATSNLSKKYLCIDSDFWI